METYAHISATILKWQYYSTIFADYLSVKMTVEVPPGVSICLQSIKKVHVRIFRENSPCTFLLFLFYIGVDRAGGLLSRPHCQNNGSGAGNCIASGIDAFARRTHCAFVDD